MSGRESIVIYCVCVCLSGTGVVFGSGVAGASPGVGEGDVTLNRRSRNHNWRGVFPRTMMCTFNMLVCECSLFTWEICSWRSVVLVYVRLCLSYIFVQCGLILTYCVGIFIFE